MKRALLVLSAFAALACGCDRLLGLSHLDDSNDGGGSDGDAGPTHVTGTLHVHHAPNDATGVPTETDDLYASTEIMLSVVLDDGSQPTVDFNATTGVFRFDIHAGKPYRLFAVTPYGATDYEFDSASLALVDRVGGRRNPMPFTSPSVLQGRFNAVAGYIFVTSTGVWTQSPTLATSSGDFDYDIGSSYLGNPRVGPLEAAQHDRVYLTAANYYGAGDATDYLALDRATSYLITLTDGGSVLLSSPPTLLNRDKCVHLTAARADASDRLHAANPAYTPGYLDWGIYASPSVSLSPVAALLLATQSGYSTNADYDVAYANPYPGTAVMAGITASTHRDISIPNSAGFPLLNTIQTMTAVSGPMMSCAPVTVTSKIGIYGAPQVAGVLLDADNKPVTIPSGTQVPVALSLAVSGPIDWTVIDLVELVDNSGQTVPIGLRHVVTNLPTAFLDASWLQPGHTYILAQTSWLGFPAASTGNLDTNGPEIANATTWSSTFVAQ